MQIGNHYRCGSSPGDSRTGEDGQTASQKADNNTAGDVCTVAAANQKESGKFTFQIIHKAAARG